MWSTLFAFSFLIAVALSLAAIRLNLWHNEDYFAGKLEPATRIKSGNCGRLVES
jgi:hypothetical protein